MPCVEVREADIVGIGPTEVDALIDRAARLDVPLRVLFAALDRYTELQRPVLDDEPEAAPVEASMWLPVMRDTRGEPGGDRRGGGPVGCPLGHGCRRGYRIAELMTFGVTTI